MCCVEGMQRASLREASVEPIIRLLWYFPTDDLPLNWIILSANDLVLLEAIYVVAAARTLIRGWWRTPIQISYKSPLPFFEFVYDHIVTLPLLPKSNNFYFELFNDVYFVMLS
jgi:hypothetical protein